jgi:hypothetical protein
LNIIETAIMQVLFQLLKRQVFHCTDVNVFLGYVSMGSDREMFSFITRQTKRNTPMKLKFITAMMVLCIVISNCSEPQVQKTTLDVTGLGNYLSNKSDFKNFVSLSAHNYSILLPMTVEERNRVSSQINDLVNEGNVVHIETFFNSNGLTLDKNRYLQNMISDLKSTFTYADDDLNSVINNSINVALSGVNSNGRVQQLPASTICSIYCAAGQINYENTMMSNGLTYQQARTVSSAWYVGCVSGCGYGISQ